MDVRVRVPHKSRWARLPFGVRMSIGCAAVVAPLVGAGTAIAVLLPDPPPAAWDDVRATAPAVAQPPGAGAGPTSSAPPGDAARTGVRPGDRTSPPAGRRPSDTRDTTADRPDAGAADAPGADGAGADGAGADGAGADGAGTDRRPAASTHRPATAATRDADRPMPSRPAGNPTASPTRTGPPGAGGPTGGGPAGGGPVGGGATSGGVRPVTATRLVRQSRPIPFRTRWVEDRSAPLGATRERTPGVPGTRVLTYQVTTVDGRETRRTLVSSTVTRRPVPRVVAVGTRPGPGGPCRPDYDGCVPRAAAAHCARQGAPRLLDGHPFGGRPFAGRSADERRLPVPGAPHGLRGQGCGGR